MEESNNVVHQRQRKRSKDNNNAFAKFVPFSPTLKHDHESYDDVDDHGYKRLKPNSDESLFYKTSTTNLLLSTSFPFPKQNIDINETLHFSSPSSSLKLLGNNSGPSPQSIGSNSSHMEYVKNDAKTISTSICQLKEDESEMESLVSMSAEELSKRPKTGGIYAIITAQRDCVVKRLNDLANKDPTIDVGLEIADAAHLLKLISFSTKDIELAGQKGGKGAMLLIQAEILHNKGQQLIAECQNLIKDTL